MVVTIYKNARESQERCITRFTKKTHRKVAALRARRFHKNKLTDRLIREGAIKREYYRALRKKNRFY